jgi:3-hydroxymyristoyl/3-hydroxydecanoyl-(acyl carrier protein) dehydratase
MLLPPVLSAPASSAGQVRLQLALPPELMVFRGHFDEAAVVPGVAQVHWAVQFACQYLGLAPGAQDVLNIKFVRPMLPGATPELQLDWDAERQRLSFRYADATGPYSQASLQWP